MLDSEKTSTATLTFRRMQVLRRDGRKKKEESAYRTRPIWLSAFFASLTVICLIDFPKTSFQNLH